MGAMAQRAGKRLASQIGGIGNGINRSEEESYRVRQQDQHD
jgi:hypothetical protein